MLNELRIEKLTRHGIALMQEEREATLKGDLARIGELNARKQDFLAEMDRLAQKLEEGGPSALLDARRQELETLFDIIRRRAAENQALLRAAAAGVKSAKREIAALAASSELMGAYNSSGEPVNASGSPRKSSELF